VLPPLSMGFKPMSAGVTPPLSLVRTHAPDRHPPPALVLPLCQESFQVAAHPCWTAALPDVISANLSQRAWTHTPPAPMVHLPISSHETTAFPKSRVGRRYRNSPYSNFSRVWVLGAIVIRLSSGPLICSPPRSLPPQRLRVGQPWLLRPRISRFVTSPSRGYASRPCTGN